MTPAYLCMFLPPSPKWWLLEDTQCGWLLSYPHYLTECLTHGRHLMYESVFSCFRHVWLCDPMDCSLPVPLSMGILQARIQEWVAMLSSRDLPDPGIEPTSLMSPVFSGGLFTTSTIWKVPLYVLFTSESGSYSAICFWLGHQQNCLGLDSALAFRKRSVFYPQ